MFEHQSVIELLATGDYARRLFCVVVDRRLVDGPGGRRPVALDGRQHDRTYVLPMHERAVPVGGKFAERRLDPQRVEDSACLLRRHQARFRMARRAQSG